MAYIILVRCDTPASTKVFTHDNGVNQVFINHGHADETVSKINEIAGKIVARAVCL